MSALALSSRTQSASQQIVVALGVVQHANVAPQSILATDETQPALRTPPVPGESAAAALGMGARRTAVNRRPPRREPEGQSELAYDDHDARVVAMAALERLECADVTAAQAVLDKAPLDVLADPAVANMQKLVVAASSIEHHLAEARYATTARQAYLAFEQAVRIVESSETSALQGIFSVYFANSNAPFKDTLLGCLADREALVNHVPTIQAVVALLGTENHELARSAALALDAGGEAASNALMTALATLPEARRTDLKRLIWFAGGH